MARKRKATMVTDLMRVGLLAPMVVAQRVGRMATTTPATRRRESGEWQRMTSEKVFAAQEAWLAAAGAVISLQQQAFAAAMRELPWGSHPALSWWQQRWIDAGQVGGAALAPVARRVADNAKRLARTR